MDRDKFIKIYTKNIIDDKARLFLGSGFSINSNLPSWEQLLAKCADALSINIKSQLDYAQVAQYYEIMYGRTELEDLISNQIKTHLKLNPILSDFLSLNFHNIWTTNYDKIIEKSLESKQIMYNLITTDKDLNKVTENQINIYKCGGDIELRKELFITRKDYEDNKNTRSMMLSCLKRELIINSFLFIGYSFKDGLIKQQLREVNSIVDNSTKHYAIIFKNDSDTTFFHYIKDLETNYNIQAIIVEDDEDFFKLINDIITEVKKHYVYISGSVDSLIGNSSVLELCNKLSVKLLENNYFLVSAAGKYIGNYMFGTALKHLKSRESNIRNKLIIEPIPESMTPAEIKEYRRNLLSKCGSIIFIAGRTHSLKSGTQDEFQIAQELNLRTIPVPTTGGTAKIIFEQLTQKPNHNERLRILAKTEDVDQIVDQIIKLLK